MSYRTSTESPRCAAKRAPKTRPVPVEWVEPEAGDNNNQLGEKLPQNLLNLRIREVPAVFAATTTYWFPLCQQF